MVNASAVCSRRVFADCAASYIPALDDEVLKREVERIPFGACIYDALFYAHIGYEPDSLNLAPPSSVAVPESAFVVRLRFSPSAEKSAKPSEPRVVADVPSNIPST